jgi:pimeloyl-ACP methyl ester carboxylesterase
MRMTTIPVGTEWWALPTSGAALDGGTDGWVDGDGVRLHFVELGSGPLVVLLHGFPDFWYGWRHQLAPLAAAGFRVVALDLRGYNLSERPARVEDYTPRRVSADVAAAIERLGGCANAVVGHDWGGVIAWHLSVTRPDVLERLAILNAPHPARYRELLLHSSQMLRSWYVAAFQIPRLPERALCWRDGAAIAAMLRAAHARAPNVGDLAAYRAVFRPPGAMEAALAYYRAVRGRALRRDASEARRTPHPTLVLWGERDPALVRANAERLERWVPDVRVLRVPGAGHFVQSDAPDAVNDALVRFVRR